MFEIPESILQDAYEVQLELIKDTHIIPLRICYKINTGTWDEINQRYTGEPLPQQIDVVCNYKEEKQIGDILTGSSFEGFPTGMYRLYIPYEQRLELAGINNYVPDSLYFILKPDTNPLTLYPKKDSVAIIEEFADRSDMPMEQKWLCSVVKV